MNGDADRPVLRVLRVVGRWVFASLVALGAAHVGVPPADAPEGTDAVRGDAVDLSAAEQRQWAAIVGRLRS